MTSTVLKELWPLLTMMRAMGWLPVNLSQNNKKLQSFLRTKIYSIVILCFQWIPATYILIKGFMLVPTFNPNIQLISSIQLLFGVLGPHLISIFAAIQSLTNINFCNQIQTLQIKIEKNSLSPKPLDFSILKRILIITIIFMISPIIMVMVIIPYAQNKSPAWKVDFYISLGYTNQYLLLGWLVSIMTILRKFSLCLIKHLKTLSECSEDERKNIPVTRLALKSRFQWLHLCNLVRNSGNTLSLSISTMVLNCFGTLAYSFYQLVGDQYISIAIFYIVFAITELILVYIICSISQETKNQVNDDLTAAIKIIKTLKMPYKVQQKMLKFFILLSKRSVTISLGGYLNLDKKLISNLISTLITNMLVMYQLRVNERKVGGLEEIFTFGDGSNVL